MDKADREQLRRIEEAWGARPCGLNWEAQNLVYTNIMPWSHKVYVGESKTGLEERGATHVRQTAVLLGRSRINLVMRQLGAHRLCWRPIRCWADEDRPGHHERLLAEGDLIWVWDPELNDRGRQTGGTPEPLRRYGDMMVLGKKHRTRHLIKFRNRKAARTFVIKDQNEVNAKKVEEGRVALQRHHRLLPFLTRL